MGQDVSLIVNMLSGGLLEIYRLIVWWIAIAFDSGLSPSLAKIIVYVFLIAAYLASPFWAATLAELKWRNRLVHFIGGLVLPFVYPALIMRAMPEGKLKRIMEEDELRKKEKEKEVSLELTGKLKPRREAYAPDKKVKISEQRDFDRPEQASDASAAELEVLPTGGPDQKYFALISKDEDGDFAGPFMLEMTDGRMLQVLRILDAREDVAVLETPGDGDTVRKIRVPYTKVRECRLESDWIDEQ